MGIIFQFYTYQLSIASTYLSCCHVCQGRLDLVFNKGQDVSLCDSIHRTSNSAVLDATPQINCCMITTNKNTYICPFILRETNFHVNHLINSYLFESSLKSSKSDV